LPQLREVVGFGHARRFLIHDRDSIFARRLDSLIPLSESRLRSILRSWAGHYPPSEVVSSATPLTRHRIGELLGVRARSVLGGLHHEYLPAPALA
jgi:hypothetical protein